MIGTVSLTFMRKEIDMKLVYEIVLEVCLVFLIPVMCYAWDCFVRRRAGNDVVHERGKHAV
jgi:hypothetical protein